MKTASKVLLIIELILICILMLVHVGGGLLGVFGTYGASDIETYTSSYNLAIISFSTLAIYLLPFVFTIYGLVKISKHKNPSNYMLGGFLVLFFSNWLAGILMVCDASDEKVLKAEDDLFDEIYGECDCEECNHDHEEEPLEVNEIKVEEESHE